MNTVNSNQYRIRHTDEVSNLPMANYTQGVDQAQLTATVSGPWWELLDELGITLAVSREYEHFIVLLGADKGTPVIGALNIPHPSGMFYDRSSGELIVSSTRTPHQIFWLRPLTASDYCRDIVPSAFQPPGGKMFLPYRSVILPGSLYIHDIAMMSGELYATVTGHNFLARIHSNGGWERVWWPALLDDMGRSAFDQNYLQLNSIAVGTSPAESFYTAFSDSTEGEKPWKLGYGPKGRGVIFDGRTRSVIHRGLTCPHSAKCYQQSLWLCNSGYGQLGVLKQSDASAEFLDVKTLNGFTRGLDFHGQYAFVGLSKVIDFYEPYAPGVDAASSVCGIVAVDVSTGSEVARLEWHGGYQIYDIQVLPGVTHALLPSKAPSSEHINSALRFLG